MSVELAKDCIKYVSKFLKRIAYKVMLSLSLSKQLFFEAFYQNMQNTYHHNIRSIQE